MGRPKEAIMIALVHLSGIFLIVTQAKSEVVHLSEREQGLALLEAEHRCNLKMLQNPHTIEGLICNRTWDGISCWPDTVAGATAVQDCPSYIDGFQTEENSSRLCTAEGRWFTNPVYNKTWTNYTSCVGPVSKELPLLEEHMWRIKILYNVGYGTSLGSLLLAVTIMLYFKKLHCPRNTLHCHLFVSFILRAAISFIKENTMVEGLGLPQDVAYDEEGGLTFIQSGTHWQCKLLLSVFNYVIGANYTWIFVEALYLHMLIFVSVFSDRSSVIGYILFGWLSPLAFVGPWIAVRAILEDVLCWNTHPTRSYYWIIRGPIVATILGNFIFFLNVVRFLFTKLRASNSPESQKYRKLARSTLVLIPLFGVHYIVFVGLPDNVPPVAELVKLYFEMLFNSFQGFFVALLFCFLNGEVQGELRKTYYRHRLRRNSFPFHRTKSNASTYVTWARNSLYSPYSAVEKADVGGSVSATGYDVTHPANDICLHEVKMTCNTGTV